MIQQNILLSHSLRNVISVLLQSEFVSTKLVVSVSSLIGFFSFDTRHVGLVFSTGRLPEHVPPPHSGDKESGVAISLNSALLNKMKGRVQNSQREVFKATICSYFFGSPPAG